MKKNHLITAIIAGSIALVGTGNLLAEKKGGGKGKERPSREEMHKKTLEKFDADGDGKLNDAEREKAHAAMKKRSAERFSKTDKNSDGKLSQDEVPEKMWNRISKADKDGDGAVSKDEMAAMHKARAGKGKKGSKGAGDNNQGKGKKPKKPTES